MMSLPYLYVLTAALAAIFLLHCAVIGTALLKWFRIPSDFAVFYGLCVGMFVNMAALFGLGILGWFTLGAVLAKLASLLMAGVAVHWITGRGAGVRLARRAGAGAGAGAEVVAAAGAGSDGGAAAATSPAARMPATSHAARMPATTKIEIAALAALFFLTVSVALHPVGHWDDTMYQLPLARSYIEHHGIVLQEYLRFPLFPQNLNLLFGLGLLLGDAVSPMQQGAVWQFGAPEVLAQVFATLPLFVMGSGLWVASRRYMASGLPGLLAAVMLFVIQPVKSTLGFAYVDNGLALFCFAASLAVAGMAAGMMMGRRDHGQDPGTPAQREAAHRATGIAHSSTLPSQLPLAALAGILAGAACGIKYFGGVFAAVLLLVITIITIVINRRSGINQALKTTLITGLVYGVAVLLNGSWWYIRSYLISGDPAHPAGASIFGFFLWNDADLALQNAEQGTYGVSRNPLLLISALKEAGVLPWILALAGLFIRRLPPAMRVLQLTFIIYLLFWFFVTQVPRYLAPVYGLGCLLSLHALYVGWQWGAQRWRARRSRGLLERTASTPKPAEPTASTTPKPAEITASRPTPTEITASTPTPTERTDATAEDRHFPRPYAALLVLALAIGYTVERSGKNFEEYLNAESVLTEDRRSYTLYQLANQHRAEYGDRVVQVGFEDGVYYFEGTVIGDWFGRGRYRDTLLCGPQHQQPPCPLPSSAELQETLQAHGARMLMLWPDHVSGFDESVFSDEPWRLLESTEMGVLVGLDAPN